MAPPDVSELMKLLRPESHKEEQCEGGGNIYAQTLLHSTKKVTEARKLNQDVHIGISRTRMGEVELLNYGTHLLEMNQTEMRRREQNKEVFTPDISRNIHEGGYESNYAKSLVDDHGPHHAERLRQEANKGAHSGAIFRNIVNRDAKGPTAETNNPRKKKLFNTKVTGI